MNDLCRQIISRLSVPNLKGSYPLSDCVFVLKDIGNSIREEENEEREEKMDGGVHYSEMLPVERYPSQEYLSLFFDSLTSSSEKMAQYIADVSEMILSEKGKHIVLVSLARAGTPIGVLMKRYIAFRHGLDIPHYSVSIIRDKGLDKNAILYILGKHPQSSIQFVDGWTGKGTINKVLKDSVDKMNQLYGLSLSSDLAVLADPAHAAVYYGTREDYFVPSSCLNSIVSGLISRTVHRQDLIGTYDFHGAKCYSEWIDKDLSLYFVDSIEKEFDRTICRKRVSEPVTYQGWSEVEEVRKKFGVNSMNKIKPGIGETTRVLLRRVPWKILVRSKTMPELKHILMLAEEKNVPVEVYPCMSYACMGLIKE